MPVNVNTDAFATLLAQGLITDDQHDAVLAHPETSSLPPVPSPAHALAWMQQQRLVEPLDASALLAHLDRLVEQHHLDAASRGEAMQIALRADALRRLGSRGIVREAVLALHATGRIDTEARDEALPRVPLTGSVPPDAGATLAWLNPDPFESLVEQGLVDRAQLDAARLHPEYATLPVPPTAGHAYAWMQLRGLAPDEPDHEALVARLGATHDEETVEEAEDTVFDAEELLEVGRRGISRASVLALHGDGLLDDKDRDEALQWVPLVADTSADPAGVLAWLVSDGSLEEERFEEIAAQAALEPAFAGANDRRRIVEQARERIAADKAVWQAAVRKRQAGARRARWIAGLSVLGIVGAVALYIMAPASVPACDADSTRHTLNSLLLRADIDQRIHRLAPADEKQASPGLARVRELREVGFRKTDRVRGCMATIRQGDRSEQMAFTIGPGAAGDDSMVVRGADEAIVEARFGHLDAEGKPRYNAEPIGREALESAVRDAVAQLQSNTSGTSAFDRLRAQRGSSGLVDIDPDRERTIAEIEPTGACHAAGDETHQACPLVVAYNDRLLAALSGGSTSIPLRAEFGFERKDGRWQVSDDFAKTFTQAVMDARLARMGIKGAAPSEQPPPPPKSR